MTPKSCMINGIAALGREEPNVLFRTIMHRMETMNIFLPYTKSERRIYTRGIDELETSCMDFRDHFRTMIRFSSKALYLIYMIWEER